ncbi:HAD family hydrolase [Paenibacillus sp. VCA1]|uniref:HAD family hydrolase n=1 Tax=Paenibacillus sp. VCA1 TaxID=3039148 RepID=UPI00287118C0|nr:HAD family hydrolase [Paenibacillus sp. VCA1]MDR9857563.1 HAD family hydrolase [Paenibacillus sp. VCA1]
MKINAVLFDFDGTLADTLPICFYSFQKVFNKYDHRDLSVQEIISMFGPSETGIIQQNLKSKDRINEAMEDYYFYYENEHKNFVSKNHEVDELIHRLHSKGIKTGIVTGKARRSYEISIKHLFSKDLFKVSITGDDVVDPKPHPEGILKAMNALGCSPAETLFVGDSNADIEAGKRANVQTVGVNWLKNSHGSEFLIKPDYVYAHIHDFVKKLFVDDGAII